jgi:hypothetical protein
MIFNYVIIFLFGLATGVNFMAWWKDRNSHTNQTGKVIRPRPWPQYKDIMSLSETMKKEFESISRKQNDTK